jgi:hypothetical protein
LSSLISLMCPYYHTIDSTLYLMRLSIVHYNETKPARCMRKNAFADVCHFIVQFFFSIIHTFNNHETVETELGQWKNKNKNRSYTKNCLIEDQVYYSFSYYYFFMLERNRWMNEWMNERKAKKRKNNLICNLH